MKLSINAFILTRADYQKVKSKRTTKTGKITLAKMLLFLKLHHNTSVLHKTQLSDLSQTVILST